MGLATLLLSVAVAVAVAVLAQGASAASRHGGVIAYSVKTGIYAINADGTGSRLLVPWQPSSCGRGCVVWKVPRNPRFSPDGTKLAYDLETNVVHKGVGAVQTNTLTVYVADSNGRHRRRIGFGHNPEFSPDGEEVIFLRNTNEYPAQPFSEIEAPEPLGEDYGPMVAVNLATGAKRRLPVPGAAEFSSTGKMLSFRQVKLTDGFHWGITIENQDGSESHFYTLRLFYAEDPRFTLGTEVSYDCPSLNQMQPDICLFNPATGGHSRLFHTRELWAIEAASSPDGREMAISGLQGLYVTDFRGHHARRILQNGSGPNYVQSDVPTSPVWQPTP